MKNIVIPILLMSALVSCGHQTKNAQAQLASSYASATQKSWINTSDRMFKISVQNQSYQGNYFISSIE